MAILSADESFTLHCHRNGAQADATADITRLHDNR
jgi:hypothetical protein